MKDVYFRKIVHIYFHKTRQNRFLAKAEMKLHYKKTEIKKAKMRFSDWLDRFYYAFRFFSHTHFRLFHTCFWMPFLPNTIDIFKRLEL